jgi:23S rRNA pseudouridine1911/1915/1917 synthase
MDFSISAKQNGKRLDRFLTEQTSFSRTHIQEMIRDGAVTVDGEAVLKKQHKIDEGTVIVFTPKEETATKHNLTPQNIPLDIIYEDEHLLVLEKDPYMIVHPANQYHTHTIAHALAYYLKDTLHELNPDRPGIVHRLDKGTSGLLVVAKTRKSHAALSLLFSQRRITKKYTTLIIGSTIPKEGTIDAPIIRHHTHRTHMMISNKPKAKRSVTHFDVIKRFPGYTLLSCHIITGRTHQIRLHMQSIGYPVIGDAIYGKNKVNESFKSQYGLERQFLHATSLEFEHPITGKPLAFTSELPEDLKKVLTALS